MTLRVRVDAALHNLVVTAMEIESIVIEPSPPKLLLWSDEAAQAAVEDSAARDSESLRTAVRQMLKHGKFKASGRSKPAQEYLLRCALEDGSLPRINNAVDALNTASLAGGLPISLLSLKKVSRQLLVRRGTTDEGYIFNSVGQVLDVEDLIVTCDASVEPTRPVGSPVKDSMAGKIEKSDTSLVALIYAPRDALGQAASLHAAELLSFGLCEFCDAVVGDPVTVAAT